jgi:hypothetical protein
LRLLEETRARFEVWGPRCAGSTPPRCRLGVWGPRCVFDASALQVWECGGQGVCSTPPRCRFGSVGAKVCGFDASALQVWECGGQGVGSTLPCCRFGSVGAKVCVRRLRAAGLGVWGPRCVGSTLPCCRCVLLQFNLNRLGFKARPQRPAPKSINENQKRQLIKILSLRSDVLSRPGLCKGPVDFVTTSE